MKVDFFLAVNDNKRVRVTKTRPALEFNEVAISLSLELPDALFRKPQLQASIVIPKEAAAPQQIEADVVNNVREAIEQASGMEVKISFVEPE